MDKKYTSKEVAEILGVSDKSVRRYLNGYFSIENGAYQVSEKMLEVLKNEYLEEESDIIVQPYTKSEYAELEKRLTEYPFLKERAESLLKDLEYHKKSIESHNRQMELILLAISNKRFLEE